MITSEDVFNVYAFYFNYIDAFYVKLLNYFSCFKNFAFVYA